MDANVSLGEIARMRKKHACGGDAFRVTFVGSDVKAKCLTCGAVIMLDRAAYVRARTKLLDASSFDLTNNQNGDR